jgi:hypothetical protein
MKGISLSKFFIGAGGVIIAIVVGLGMYIGSMYLGFNQAGMRKLYGTPLQPLLPVLVRDDIKDIIPTRAKGDVKGLAVKLTEYTRPDVYDKLTDDEKAVVNSNYIAKYRATGAEEDAILTVRHLKQNILNANLSRERRAQDIDTLALTYCTFGRDQDTLKEIFTGEPFNRFYVEGDGALSARKMLEWAYNDVYKNARTAIQIGRWYPNRALVRPLDPQTVEEYKILSKKYMAEADELNQQEIEKFGQVYLNSRRYVSYVYWRIFIRNGLIALGDTTLNAEEERAKYEELRQLIIKQNNATSWQFIPFTYIVEANFAHVIDKDDDKARALIDKAMDAMRSDPDQKADELAEFIKDSWGQKWGGFVVSSIQNAAEISPEFKKMVEDEIITETYKTEGFKKK